MKGYQGHTTSKRIYESRAKRSKICTELPDDDQVAREIRIDSMTLEEIKVRLKDRGITTRLQELFFNTLREEQISRVELF